MDSNSKAQPAEVLARARNQVRVGPLPPWAAKCSYDSAFKGRKGDHLTRLLESYQVHAELGQRLVQSATRLESMEAVQHLSQWRMHFEPATQSVTVHWIAIRRGGQDFEQAAEHKFHFLQREEGLDRFVIDGWCMVLLLLEDVRPGDIVEWCYTIHTSQRVLPDNCFVMFSLPQEVPVGRYHFSLRFREPRPMKWKSSSADFKPQETREGAESLWVWAGENYAGVEPEPCTPAWYIPQPWIQISDCADWQLVAAAVSEAWKEELDSPGVAALAEELKAREPDPLRCISNAIGLVQDEYRYLSVNLELGGYVPSPPSAVLRKRYGDCKDLSFLLVHLLRALGVAARPILVNVSLGKSVAELLPTPTVFNHVVVEYVAAGQTRWVDPTLKLQGGGALERAVPDFGVGLPVERTATGLVRAPAASHRVCSYELRESVLLDTTGNSSLLAVTVLARGRHADALRRQFESVGVEGMEKERLQVAGTRFGLAQRSGKLEFRDNRELKEFALTEVFEVNRFLRQTHNPHFCKFVLPINLPVELLPTPPSKPRHGPLALPQPGLFTHVLDVEGPITQLARVPDSDVRDPFLRFTRNIRNRRGFWTITLTLQSLGDAVLPEGMQKYQKTVEEIRKQSLWELTLPMGHSRPVRRRGFGELPPPASKPSPLQVRNHTGTGVAAHPPKSGGGTASVRLTAAETLPLPEVQCSKAMPEPKSTGSPAQPSIVPADPHHRRRRKKRSRHLRWVMIGVAVAAVALFKLFLLIQKHH